MCVFFAKIYIRFKTGISFILRYFRDMSACRTGLTPQCIVTDRFQMVYFMWFMLIVNVSPPFLFFVNLQWTIAE